jgi:hypothetical protein
MSSKIKWMGEISQKFPIHQGVCQGGVLSTHLYKVYIYSLLHEFNRRRIGMKCIEDWRMKIGNIYVGSPTRADDTALLTDNPEDMQIMLNKKFCPIVVHCGFILVFPRVYSVFPSLTI